MDSQKRIKYINAGLTILIVMASILTICSLLLAMELKTEGASSWILAHYSRYNLAMAGIKTLETNPQPYMTVNGPLKNEQGDVIKGTVLGIDDPSWNVMFDFMRSEIAFRKSDRNYQFDDKQNNPNKKSSNVPDRNKNEINWDRIKTIFVLYLTNVAKVGNKPLAAPYRAIVFWPGLKGHSVYNFLSFEEFRLDVKKMLSDELEYYSYMLALIGALGTAILPIIKRIFCRPYAMAKSETPAPSQGGGPQNALM